MPRDINAETTYVYRLFDSLDELLYVGMTVDVTRRVAHHRSVQAWGDQIVRTQSDAYPDRKIARAAEKVAVASLTPKHTRGDGGSGRRPNTTEVATGTKLRRLGEARRASHEALRQGVLEALNQGVSVRVAAELAQVSTATVQSWKAAAAKRSR